MLHRSVLSAMIMVDVHTSDQIPDAPPLRFVRYDHGRRPHLQGAHEERKKELEASDAELHLRVALVSLDEPRRTVDETLGALGASEELRQLTAALGGHEAAVPVKNYE